MSKPKAKGPEPFNSESEACRLVSYRMTKSVPSEQLWAGDELIVEPSGRVEHGALHVIGYEDRTRIDHIRIDRIFVVDPTHIRVGGDPENIDLATDVKVVGPVTGISRLVDSRGDAAPCVTAALPPQEDAEWPDEIVDEGRL